MDFKVKALYDYKKQEEGELSLKQGCIYTIVDKQGNWWKAVDKDKHSGLIPSNYVKAFEEKPALTNSENDQKDKKVCFECNQNINRNYVTANNNVYHNICFKCKNCDVKLGGKPYIVKENYNYCENCYDLLFSVKCALCSEIIKGQYIKAMEQNWHPDHFVCCGCGNSFEESYKIHEEKPYCFSCFDENFSIKCIICDQIINGDAYNFQEAYIHVNCFKCSVDSKIIKTDEPFHLKEKKLYCSQHFKELNKKICSVCKEAINDKIINVMDSFFHVDCFKCYECKKQLFNTSFTKTDLGYICKIHEKNVSKNLNPEHSNQENPNIYIEEKEKTFVESQKEMQKEEKKLHGTYTLIELQKKKSQLPQFLNYSKREIYLTDKEFIKAFKMTKDEFYKLTLWKQRQLKRKANLF